MNAKIIIWRTLQSGNNGAFFFSYLYCVENEFEIFYPKHPAEWRQWLLEHHQSKTAVWVVFYKKNSGHPTLSWSEAVDQALCFGWIDSVKKKLDDERAIQFFSKRKTNGTWSKVNKDKVEKLIESGLMTKAGLKTIETAKQNGSWSILDEVEALTMPEDLARALKRKKGALFFYSGLGRTAKKGILQWLVLAKRPETRKKRIDEIAELAQKGLKPKHIQ